MVINSETQSSNETPATLNTAKYAELNGVGAATIRNHLCKFGHYYGVKPTRMASGRLLWPAIQAKA